MTDNHKSPLPDPIWDVAWAWVQRQHDRASFDESARAELLLWLEESPAHHQAYDKAGRLWLLIGLVPPSTDIDTLSD